MDHFGDFEKHSRLRLETKAIVIGARNLSLGSGMGDSCWRDSGLIPSLSTIYRILSPVRKIRYTILVRDRDWRESSQAYGLLVRFFTYKQRSFFLLIKTKLYVFVILENSFEISKVLSATYIVNTTCQGKAILLYPKQEPTFSSSIIKAVNNIPS